jgi:hypothetical protein
MRKEEGGGDEERPERLIAIIACFAEGGKILIVVDSRETDNPATTRR